MAWRLATSLVVLRDQINAAYPNRNRASDGTIGDAAHSSTVSQHNPNPQGVVTAMDITHDPAHGVDGGALANMMTKDSRTWYVIWNSRIWETGVGWQAYYGSNPHSSHVHISTLQDSANYDKNSKWNIGDDMEDISLEIGRILYAFVGYDGMRGKPNALAGEMDGEITRATKGQKLSGNYIRSLYQSTAFKDAQKTLGGIYAEAMARRAEGDGKPIDFEPVTDQLYKKKK